MWLQVIVDLLNIIKFVLEKLGVYTPPTTTQEAE